MPLDTSSPSPNYRNSSGGVGGSGGGGGGSGLRNVRGFGRVQTLPPPSSCPGGGCGG